MSRRKAIWIISARHNKNINLWLNEIKRMNIWQIFFMYFSFSMHPAYLTTLSIQACRTPCSKQHHSYQYPEVYCSTTLSTDPAVRGDRQELPVAVQSMDGPKRHEGGHKVVWTDITINLCGFGRAFQNGSYRVADNILNSLKGNLSLILSNRSQEIALWEEVMRQIASLDVHTQVMKNIHHNVKCGINFWKEVFSPNGLAT